MRAGAEGSRKAGRAGRRGWSRHLGVQKNDSAQSVFEIPCIGEHWRVPHGGEGAVALGDHPRRLERVLLRRGGRPDHVARDAGARGPEQHRRDGQGAPAAAGLCRGKPGISGGLALIGPLRTSYGRREMIPHAILSRKGRNPTKSPRPRRAFPDTDRDGRLVHDLVAVQTRELPVGPAGDASTSVEGRLPRRDDVVM